MKKILAAFAFALMLAPIGASAAVNRAFVDPMTAGGSGLEVNVSYLDGNTVTTSTVLTVPYSAVTSQTSVLAFIASAVNMDASNRGYMLSGGTVFQSLQAPDVQALIDASIAGITQPVAMSFSTPTLTLNTAFQPSATRASSITVSVEQSTTLSLSGGQTANAFLEYADDSGFTTNVKEIGRSTNGNTGTLTLGLNITQVNTATISGIVPAGKYVRIRTTGTGTQTFRSAQQVLLPSN